MSTTTAPDLELVLSASAENVAVVRHALGGVGDALELDAEVMADVKLAVSEACANVVVHAYVGRDGGLLTVELSSLPGRLEIVVRDRGRGLAPRTDSPGLGVGLPLIASLATTLELSGHTGGGTEVRMAFALDRAAGPTDPPSSDLAVRTGAIARSPTAPHQRDRA